MRYTITLAVLGIVAIALGVTIVVPVAQRAAAGFARVAAALPK